MSYRDRDHVSVNAGIGTDPLLEPQQARLEGRRFDKTDGMEEKRVPQVEIETDRIVSLTNSLASKISDIENRLQPVLNQSPQAGCTSKPAPSKCALAAELSDIGDKLQEILERSKSIMDRLEL